jgi:uncharacterized protein with HEPN domain
MAQRIVIYVVVIVCSLVALYYLQEWSYRRWMERRIAPIVCRSNLKVIGEAKASWAHEHHKSTNDLPTWSDLLGTNGYIRGSQPLCRSGGTYTIGRVGAQARCSIPEHNFP